MRKYLAYALHEAIIESVKNDQPRIEFKGATPEQLREIERTARQMMQHGVNLRDSHGKLVDKIEIGELPIYRPSIRQQRSALSWAFR